MKSVSLCRNGKKTLIETRLLQVASQQRMDDELNSDVPQIY